MREIATDLWVAEGSLRYAGVEMGRRMAVARLAGGDLWIHSPISLTEQLQGELDRSRYIVELSSGTRAVWTPLSTALNAIERGPT